MIDDHAAFLRAIVENPHDLLTRQVYADYLEETGDPNCVARAHLIRVQIALEDTTVDPEDWQRLKDFEARLLDMFQVEWDCEAPLWVLEEGSVEYRRGFIEHVSLLFPRLVLSAKELFATLPIRSLEIRAPHVNRQIQQDLFEGLPPLSAIERLKFDSLMVSYFNEGDNENLLLNQLLNCPSLTGLKTLNVSSTRVSDPWVVALVSRLPQAAFASTLETLDFSYCVHITDAGCNALATARSLQGLQRLVLHGIPLRQATRTMLQRSFGSRVTF